MSAAEALGLPPGVRFDPTDDELVEFYLLPRALGRPTAVPGIIIEDDAATATATTSAQHPWKLLKRHRRTDDSEAYFFERVDATKGGGAGARQDRSCDGGCWTWVGQKRAPDEALPLRGDGDGDGEHASCSWGKYSLNLQKGRCRGGSTGWVMHEYTVASPSPQCPLLPVKLCHVSFTGHGQKRQRVPDDDELEHQATPAAQHKRAATGSSPSAMVTTAMPNQELSEARENQEQLSPIYNSSTVGYFWSSDAGFSQESSIILDPPYPDARSNHQEPFPLDQESSASQLQAYHQQQFVNPGSIQEPPAGHPLIEEEQFSWAQLLGVISSPRCPPTATTPAAYHEQQQIQRLAQAAMADLPLSTDQESCTTEQSHGDTDQDDFFRGWGGDLDSFCDTSGIQDDDDMAAAQTLAGDGCGGGMSWDRHFFYQQPAAL